MSDAAAAGLLLRRNGIISQDDEFSCTASKRMHTHARFTHFTHDRFVCSSKYARTFALESSGSELLLLRSCSMCIMLHLSVCHAVAAVMNITYTHFCMWYQCMFFS